MIISFLFQGVAGVATYNKIESLNMLCNFFSFLALNHINLGIKLAYSSFLPFAFKSFAINKICLKNIFIFII